MGKVSELKGQAISTLKGKWGSFAGLTIIYLILYGLASCFAQFGSIFQGSSFTVLTNVFTVTGVITSIIFVPMQYGYYVAHLNSSRQDLPADIGDLFCGYRRFTDVFFTLLLQSLAIAGAMSLALVFIGILVGLGQTESHPGLFMLIAFVLMIPGFVLAIAYSMVPFILHDRPGHNPVDVLRESRMMMQGHKMELFLLMLSFIGWIFLCVLSLGVGLLWVAPYMQMTEVKFYEQIRAEYEGFTVQDTETVAEDTAPTDESQIAADPEAENPASSDDAEVTFEN